MHRLRCRRQSKKATTCWRTASLWVASSWCCARRKVAPGCGREADSVCRAAHGSEAELATAIGNSPHFGRESWWASLRGAMISSRIDQTPDRRIAELQLENERLR